MQRRRMAADGAKGSIEAMDASFSRLKKTLIEAGPKGPFDHEAIFSDAWAIVDYAERLRKLLEGLPGLDKETPDTASLLKALSKATKLRHYIQHLDREINRQASSGVPAGTWGSLSWIVRLGSNEFAAVVAIRGTLAKGMSAPVTRAASPEGPLGGVTLSIPDASLEISDLLDQIHRWVSDHPDLMTSTR